MGNKLNDAEKGQLEGRLLELRRMTASGACDFSEVMDATQALVEGRAVSIESRGITVALPHHEDGLSYPKIKQCTPEDQLIRARQLWPRVDLPDPPVSFVPQTETEVLLLHVPDEFDNLWNHVKVPDGHTKWRCQDVKADQWHLRLEKEVPHRTEPIWLGFDPVANLGESPDVLWGQSNLAASEVLSALIQFPEWATSWNDMGGPYPSLAGYQIRHGRSWSSTPCLYLDGKGTQLRLDGSWAVLRCEHLSSPVVREC